MIAYVSGTLVHKKPTAVVVEVGGMGYHVNIPTSTYEKLPAEGQAVRLYTHFIVREDAQLLYGFLNEAERTLFETLISVSGVGPKMAVAALSAHRPAELRRAILEGDAVSIAKTPGIGRKTADRIVVDLRDQMLRLDLGASSLGQPGDTQARADALAALEALGLSRPVAERALRKVFSQHPDEHSADALIRLALREAL